MKILRGQAQKIPNPKLIIFEKKEYYSPIARKNISKQKLLDRRKSWKLLELFGMNSFLASSSPQAGKRKMMIKHFVENIYGRLLRKNLGRIGEKKIVGVPTKSGGQETQPLNCCIRGARD